MRNALNNIYTRLYISGIGKLGTRDAAPFTPAKERGADR